jgi:hypothetical protein
MNKRHLAFRRLRRSPSQTNVYRITDAVVYLSRRLGFQISLRTFRFYVHQGLIKALRSPGTHGRYFWTRAMLDEIAAQYLEMARRPREIGSTKRRAEKAKP